MMSLWDALRMNMMISYQELVRTFLSFQVNKIFAKTYLNHFDTSLFTGFNI